MHAKNTVRYFLLLVFVMLFFFFTNDFGLVGVQKTAIVTAIAIDKEEDGFSLAVQIANPSKEQGSGGGEKEGGGTQNGNSQYPCVEGKGKTVAQALDEAEKSTGWLIKLVFCKLIILGESFTEMDAFDALDYFLLDEYMNDDCLLAAVDGKAAELLKAKTQLGASSALAIEKVLSPTAKSAGVSLPCNLKDFAVGYFGASRSGVLPLLEQEENFFKAEKTALFKDGKRIGVLNAEETFALSVVKNPLRLASYTTQVDGVDCTLTVRKSNNKRKFSIKENTPVLEVELALYAGVKDNAKSRPIEDLKDLGNLPSGALAVASQSLASQIERLHQKCKTLAFDAFEAIDMLQKHENDYFEEFKETLPERLELELTVHFEGLR